MALTRMAVDAYLDARCVERPGSRAAIDVLWVDVLKHGMVAAFVEYGHGIERSWAALVNEDVPWCLVCKRWVGRL